MVLLFHLYLPWPHPVILHHFMITWLIPTLASLLRGKKKRLLIENKDPLFQTPLGPSRRENRSLKFSGKRACLLLSQEWNAYFKGRRISRKRNQGAQLGRAQVNMWSLRLQEVKDGMKLKKESGPMFCAEVKPWSFGSIQWKKSWHR